MALQINFWFQVWWRTEFWSDWSVYCRDKTTSSFWKETVLYLISTFSSVPFPYHQHKILHQPTKFIQIGLLQVELCHMYFSRWQPWHRKLTFDVEFVNRRQNLCIPNFEVIGQFMAEIKLLLKTNGHHIGFLLLFDSDHFIVTNSAYQQQQQPPFNGLCSGTTRVGRYQKKHSAFCLSIGLCCVQAGFPHLLSSGFLCLPNFIEIGLSTSEIRGHRKTCPVME